MFKRKDSEIFVILCIGWNLSLGEKIQRTLLSEDLAKVFFQEKRYKKRYNLMTWKKPVFKRKDTKIGMFWWFGEALYSRENTLKSLGYDVLKKDIFSRKDRENVVIWWFLEKFLSRELIVNSFSSHDLEKLIFKRKDTEILLIGCFGRSLFSREKIQRTLSREKMQGTLWSDDLEEPILKWKDTQNVFHLMKRAQ